MNIIDSPATLARALDQPLDPDLKRLLALRHDQLAGCPDAARFIIVGSADGLADVEEAIGFPLLTEGEPTWEWTERHGGIVEVAFVFGDTADVLLVPDAAADLIDLIHRHTADDFESRHATAR